MKHLLHVRLGKNSRRGVRKIIRAKGPESLLCYWISEATSITSHEHGSQTCAEQEQQQCTSQGEWGKA